MPSGATNSVIERLRMSVLLREGSAVGDGELLDCFIEHRDQAALAVLIRRHGPMVWGVCRRLLSHHEAEDAFQATFLVLVRKAASIMPRVMVGNWLYGVARQTALQARRSGARRRLREAQVTVMPDNKAAQQDHWPDLQPVLDEELSRLPDNYRAVIVLCDLENRTRKEVARQLGVPEGTVAGRLSRARALLARRLIGRGVTLSGGVLATVLAQNMASAAVPDSVLASTIGAASFIALGREAVAWPVSAKVAALAEGVLKAMMIGKLKAAVSVVLVLGAVLIGASVLTTHMAAAHGDQPLAAEAPAKEPTSEEQEALTAWGKEVGGLQAGLGFRPGEKRAYHHGETVTLVVRVRNVGKETVKFEYVKQFLDENPPTVTDAGGKALPQGKTEVSGLIHVPVQVNLEPGKEIVLESRFTGASGLRYELMPAGVGGKRATRELPLHVGTGKVSLQYEQVFGNSSSGRIKLDPALSKLGTGKLELELKDTEKSPPKEKEDLTAWGKEVGGLQAGLGFRPGQKRVYSPGETVKLVVRVRNVGKKAAGIQYFPQFFIETPPAVTDSEGKQVTLTRRTPSSADGPVQVNLEPGKEAELYELKLDARSGAQSVNDREWTLFGTGKFQIQYERVMYSSGKLEIDPILGRLATGKLDLEIKFDSPPEPPGKKTPDANAKPIKIRVYIEKVNEESSTIDASCMLIGAIDNGTKPVRLENLRVAEKARIVDGSKELKLTDVKLLPRDTHFYLFLKTYEEEFGFEVVGIETIRK